MGSIMMWLYMGNSVFWDGYPPWKNLISTILFFVEDGEDNWQMAYSDLPVVSLLENIRNHSGWEIREHKNQTRWWREGKFRMSYVKDFLTRVAVSNFPRVNKN